MRKVIYTETRPWAAFQHCTLPVTISVIQNPSGYSVFISTDEQARGQHLTIEQAESMYRNLSRTLWGESVQPVLLVEKEKEKHLVYCDKCGEQIGYFTVDVDKAEVTKEYHFSNTLTKRCCRGSRNRRIR